MRKVLLIVFVLISICCFGQNTTQENNDTLSLKRKLFSVSTTSSSFHKNDVALYSGFSTELNPILNYYQQINYANRFLLDQNLTNQLIISDFYTITTLHFQSNFIELGGLNFVQVNSNFKPGDMVVFYPVFTCEVQ
jgi:hypothetical protein